jgi:hypothetical protein
VSHTRRRLNWLRRDHGLRCLETNVFAEERPGGHGDGKSNAELLQLFFSTFLRLKTIIVHGDVAKRVIGRLELPAWLHVEPTRHFRFLSRAKIAEIAAQLAKNAV